MKIRSIQFLRAIAVMLVVYMHSLSFQPHAIQQHFFFLPQFGAIGVDIFFVISGFIITWSALQYKGGREGAKFLYNRFLRLVPVYWLATLVFIAALHLKGYSFHQILQLDAAGRPPLRFMLKTVLLLPVADNTVFILHLLSVAWTLSFEWLFYFLFFGAILFSIRRKEVFLCGLFLALAIVGRIFFHPPHPADARLIFLTDPILLEFALGMGICWCYRNIKLTTTTAWLLLLSGIACYLCEIVVGYGNIPTMENIVNGISTIHRLLLWGVPSALLVAGCIFLEKNNRAQRIWNNRLLTRIGDASYSIYLTHLSIYTLCITAYGRMGFSFDPDLAVWLQWVLAIIAGILFYKYAEAPLLRRLRGRQLPRDSDHTPPGPADPHSNSTTLAR